MNITPQVRLILAEFLSCHLYGWSDREWTILLARLQAEGVAAEPEALGLLVEKERLRVLLSEAPGIGPRRVEFLVERYKTLWELLRIEESRLAGEPVIGPELAQAVLCHLRLAERRCTSSSAG